MESAAGDSLLPLGEAVIPLSLGKKVIRQPVVVVPGLVYPMIVGRNCLQQFEYVCIYWHGHRKGQVKIDGEVFYGAAVSTRRKVAAVAAAVEDPQASQQAPTPSIVAQEQRKVHVPERVKIPGRTKQRVRVTVDGDQTHPGEIGTVLPNEDNFVTMASAVFTSLDSEKCAYVVVVNSSDRPRYISPESVLGLWEETDMSQRVCALRTVVDEHDVSLLSKKEEATLSEEERKDAEGKRACLKELNIDLSCFAGTPAERKAHEELLGEYRDCFDDGWSVFNYDNDLPPHEIDTGNHRPIKQKVRRFAPKIREAEEKEIEKLKNRGIIKDSMSEWGFPVVMVPKKNGDYRMCIDYRALNDITVKDSYPLPDIKDCLATLTGMKFFSTLDAKSGFWQVPMHKRDARKTAFISNHGLFEFLGMPMGLTNAPASFQRLMNALLAGLTWRECLVFVDDIIIFAKDMQEHLRRLRAVLDALRGKMKLNGEKCHIGRTKLVYLGHEISADGVAMDPAKHKAVTDFRRPTNRTELQSWLGLGNWYRKFIKDYAKLVHPFKTLLKKEAAWVWTEEHEQSFIEMKKVLTSAPVLAWPDPTLPYKIYTDGSKKALCAVLEQEKDGLNHAIQYWSRGTNGPESGYTTSELELLAVVGAIKEFRPYIAGFKFTVITDHWALKWLKTLKDPDGRLGRWALTLQEYDFDVEFRKGVENHVDCLSRPPDEYLNTHPEQKEHWQKGGQPEVEKGNAHPSLPEAHLPQRRAKEKKEDYIQRLLEWARRHCHGSENSSPQARTNRVSVARAAPSTENANEQADTWMLDAVAYVCANRSYKLPSTSEESLKEWKAEQERDPQIKIYLDYLREQKLPEDQKTAGKVAAECTHLFVDEDGILRSCLKRLSRGNSSFDSSPVAVCPESMKHAVMKQCHDDSLSGHFGVQKTFARVVDRCWWPGMFVDILNYVNTCTTCQKGKAKPLQGQGEIYSIQVGEPFHRVGVDFVGVLPETTARNKFILVFTDYLTKWVEAFAVPSDDASTVAQIFLEEIVCRHGCPEVVLSDRAQAFCGEVMSETKKLLGSRQSLASAWHPQTNGQTEKFNGTMCMSLKAYANKNHKDWDVYLPYVLFAYRTSKHFSTQQTPFFLMHGREARMPLDWHTNKPYDRRFKYSDDYRKVLVKGLTIAREQAKYFIEKAQHEQRRQRHKAAKRSGRASKKPYHVGDLVMLHNTRRSDKAKGVTEKFLHIWNGPYRIKEARGPNVFILEDVQTNKEWKGGVNIDRIRPWRQRPPLNEGEEKQGSSSPVSGVSSSASSSSSTSETESSGNEASSSSDEKEEEKKRDEPEEKVEQKQERKEEKEEEEHAPPARARLTMRPAPIQGTTDQYQVEDVLEKRWNKKKRTSEYLLKWVGYPKPTWEPERNVSADLQLHYQNKLNQKEEKPRANISRPRRPSKQANRQKQGRKDGQESVSAAISVGSPTSQTARESRPVCCPREARISAQAPHLADSDADVSDSDRDQERDTPSSQGQASSSSCVKQDVAQPEKNATPQKPATDKDECMWREENGHKYYIAPCEWRGRGTFAGEHIPQGAVISFRGVVHKTLKYGTHVMQGGLRSKGGLVWIDGSPEANNGQIFAGAMCNEPRPSQWCTAKWVPTPGGGYIKITKPGGLKPHEEVLVCYGKRFVRSYPHNHVRSRCNCRVSAQQWKVKESASRRQPSKQTTTKMVWRRKAQAEAPERAPVAVVDPHAARQEPHADTQALAERADPSTVTSSLSESASQIQGKELNCEHSGGAKQATSN